MNRPLAVSFVQLEAFSEVVRLGSFTRAAHSLHLTQAGLSARLLKLEQQLDCTLFERTPRGARLTDAGRAFLPFARRALTALGEGARLVRGIPAGGLGQLELACSPEVSRTALSRILGAFHEATPHVQMRVRTHPADAVLDLVAREEVHLGLVPSPDRRDVEASVLYAVDLVLVAAPEHDLAGRAGVRLADVAEHTVLVVDRAEGTAEDVLFHMRGLALMQALEVDSIETAKRLAADGLGIAPLPLPSVAAELRSGDLCLVTPADVPASLLRIAAVRRAVRSPLGDVLDRYVALAVAACAGIDDGAALAGLAAERAPRDHTAGLSLAGLMHSY